jgi:protein-S-isoprenylcysteine O-methyltransferase Ste14
MSKIIIFLLVSLIITKFSWPTLFALHKHGFYRFFAFEFFLILILVNSTFWFYHPLSFFQIISWLLLVVALVLFSYGFDSLRRHGKPISNIETTTSLVTSGIYKYIRHPLYSSLLFFSAGCFFKNASLLATSLFFVVIVFFYATARTEEKENLIKFGNDYAVYIKGTEMFIPFVF